VGIADSPAGPPLPCASGGQYLDAPTGSSAVVTLSGLPAGQWTAYPSYCTEFGCSNPTASPRTVVTTAGKTTKVKLTAAYQVPPNGLVNVSVAVSGAPAGFDEPTGVYACQISIDSSYCEGTGGAGVNSLLLNDGTWVLVGYYTVSPFGNAIVGPEEIINVQGGQTTALTLDVPYQTLGAVTGSIKISGLPKGVHPTGYWVSACPTGGGLDPLVFLSCVYEYSGSGGSGVIYGARDLKRFGRSAHRAKVHEAAGAKLNSIDLPTLTPGQWSVTAGYSTEYGSFGSGEPLTVDVTAGWTTRAKVTVPYEPPFQGVVTGKVDVVGAPGGDFSAGVMACSTLPTAGTCTDEVDGGLNADGTYQLPLFPGTWWVQGVAYVYNGLDTDVVTSAPRQEDIVAGTRDKANFVVPITP
jgi:hypothetical protein